MTTEASAPSTPAATEPRTRPGRYKDPTEALDDAVGPRSAETGHLTSSAANAAARS
jgi:hypothetical protein